MKILNVVLLFAFVSFIYSCSENENLTTENKYEINVEELSNENLVAALENSLEDVDFNQINKHLNTSIGMKSFDFANAQLVSENKEGSTSILVEINQPGVADSELYITTLVKGNEIGSLPMIVKIVGKEELSYYDIMNGVALEGAYDNDNFKFVKSTYGTPLAGEKCGQDVADCMGDAYGGQGWASVYIAIQTAFIPWTAVGVAAACAAINCG